MKWSIETVDGPDSCFLRQIIEAPVSYDPGLLEISSKPTNRRPQMTRS